jgi:GPH family glycoside/pentoside/hexuronide:cation symporter
MENNNSLIAKSSGLKIKDYLAYAMGDVGCCLVFSLVSSLLQTYYTDVLILNPLFVMLIFVIARVWDAINDPIMGRICDVAKPSKYGKYRHWFIWGGVPLVASSIMMFVKFPGFGVDPANNLAAYIYAALTYVLFGMMYTMVQIPYGSLASVVTLDEKERTKLSVFRSVGSALGSLPVMILQMLCFKKDPDTGANIVNYTILIIGVIVMSILAFGMLLFAFYGTKERVKIPPVVHEKGATKKALKKVLSNKAMVSISVVSMLLLAGQMFTQSYYVYLIRYYFGKTGIFVSLPTILTYIPMAILMVFTPKLVRKYGKKEITAVGMAVAAIANLAMFFLKFLSPEAALWPFMGLCFVSGFGLNLFALQVWAMATDAIDDIEVKEGIRQDGTAYSAFMFFRKMGQVIAAIAVNGALLAMGYFSTSSSGSFVFTNDQLGLMYILATIIPAVMFGIMSLLLFVWYPLSKKKVEELQDLKEKRLEELEAKENNK